MQAHGSLGKPQTGQTTRVARSSGDYNAWRKLLFSLTNAKTYSYGTVQVPGIKSSHTPKWLTSKKMVKIGEVTK